MDGLKNVSEGLAAEKEKLSIGIDLAKYRVDLSRNVPEPPPLLKQPDTGCVLFTEGNTSAIAGADKSRKTFLVSAMSAAILGSEQLTMSGVNDTSTVVIIDTEQDICDTYIVARRVHRMMGWDVHTSNERFQCFFLRELSVEERIAFCETVVDTIKPNVMFIDGIADLCNNFNDLEQSKAIVGWTASLASKTRTHICMCIHFNKSSTELRGHLGAFLKQKGELTIGVDKKDGYSEVYALSSRRKPFDKFCIAINDKGLPILFEPTPVSLSKKLQVAENAVREILSLPNTMRHDELEKAIEEKLKVSPDTAKRRIKELKGAGILEVNAVGLYHLHQNEEDCDGELPF